MQLDFQHGLLGSRSSNRRRFVLLVNDRIVARAPQILEAIARDSAAIGFAMASEPQTGSLLRTLAASKPGGRLLEIGTGTGISRRRRLSR
jgi:predicted O-methyltransferase YrrM